MDKGFPSEAALTRERACLGAAIVDPTGHQAGILAAMARESDFSTDNTRKTFRCIKRLVGRGVVPLEYASVIAELQDMGVFESFGNGWAWVCSLGEGILTSYSMVKRVQELTAQADRRHQRLALERKLHGDRG